MTKKNHLIEYWPNGNKKREGHYRMHASTTSPNEKIGVWTSWYENGNEKAQVSHDGFISCRNGPARSWYESGQIETEIEFTNGHIDGQVTIWYEDGQIALKGWYRGGQISGEWNAWYKNGQQRYQGFFYNLFTHSSYFDDVIHTWEEVLEEKWNWDDESIEDPIDDEQDESWYGQNPFFWWDIDSEDDGKEGTWTEWYENGEKKSETMYKDYDDYQNDIFEYYNPSEKNGLATEWYENGQIKSEGNYADNLKFGEFNEWYESGAIKSINHYLEWWDYPDNTQERWWDEELKDGKCIIFDEEGLIRSEEYYIKGELVESNEYPKIDD